MPGSRPRAAWTGGLLAVTSLATVLACTPAGAVSGPAAPDTVSVATARLDIGDGRGCSATLVSPQWLLTAASCFTDASGSALTAGAPKAKTTATIGGSTQQVVNLVPRADRDVVMAQLAAPVTGVTPLPVTGTAPVAGDEVQAAGFGRTHDEWVPGQVHAAAFSLENITATTVGLAGKPDSGAICKGDTGGPIVSSAGGHTAVSAVSSLSWQGGCLGTDPAETRTGAVAARVDDLAGWVQQIVYHPAFAGAPWKHAVGMTAGYFTGGSPGGSRHMDLIVRWDDGEVTLYQGGSSNDPAHPFAAEYRLAASKSIWAKAVSMTAVDTGGTAEGLVVRWIDGEMTLYTNVDAKGFHGEKQLAAPGTALWRDQARLMAGGHFTAGTDRDDLLVTFDDGHVSLFTHLTANGLRKQTQITPKNTVWPHAGQLTAGSFTSSATDDVIVRWSDGETTLYPGLTAGGLPHETRLRPANSPWKDAVLVTAGAFTANTSADDVLVRWSDGRLSLFPGVDANGLHAETPLTTG
ncbi:S1 family peptidase [Streptomyces acidiscabies]|uniref:S1 family peptidase n=2 Tax=Streptomyces acidiscabies TaxID=42234 RepID=A0AAP6ELJ2_9ACTN|nr:S1 family peptidase [Streptomyces acidiscabies]MBZ3912615.1 S1 family peptidase [Streptomyces acidiscabies]MDX2966710.1 S1 family peptidase [Streptomyces acidiscabies]MDX3018465.1 S1 family peptidase [Streptomyces acidiscabies]MDX3796515.1 S1 family peptidase [Streptomyces acidiscabies]GAQ51114.1 trypsin [Streptomyces acidiscabies]